MSIEEKTRIVTAAIKLLQNNKQTFICSALREATEDVYGIGEIRVQTMLNWFYTKKPNKDKYSEFLESKAWRNGYAWWENNIEGRLQRILFLRVLHKELKDL